MEKQRLLRFPEGFLWGTATSSHQYEGDNTNNHGIAGSSRVIFAQANVAAKPPTGGREPKAILSWPNAWAITRCG